MNEKLKSEKKRHSDDSLRSEEQSSGEETSPEPVGLTRLESDDSDYIQPGAFAVISLSNSLEEEEEQSGTRRSWLLSRLQAQEERIQELESQTQTGGGGAQDSFSQQPVTVHAVLVEDDEENQRQPVRAMRVELETIEEASAQDSRAASGESSTPSKERTKGRTCWKRRRVVCSIAFLFVVLAVGGTIGALFLSNGDSDPIASSPPTYAPTLAPSAAPSPAPTPQPSLQPSYFSAPSTETLQPSAAPSAALTGVPTLRPTPFPSSAPSVVPTVAPSFSPTGAPTARPTVYPTTSAPTAAPTVYPTTSAPTAVPTIIPFNPPNNDNDVWNQLGTAITGQDEGEALGRSLAMSRSGRTIAVGSDAQGAGRVRVGCASFN